MQPAKASISTRLKRTIPIIKELQADLKRDDVPGLGAEIAYHAIFAIPPLIILVVTVAAMINQFTGYDLAEQLVTTIEENAPEEVRLMLITLVNNAIANVSGGLASFGVLMAAVIALWSGSNGIATMIKAFNRAYGATEARTFIALKSLAIGMTILFAVLINAAFMMLVFGQEIAEWVSDRFDLGDWFLTLTDFARFPIALLFVIVVLTLLYYFGPAVQQRFRFVLPGAIFATLLWIAAVFGFKIYLQFVNPGSAYGALGSIVVLMFFMFISAIIFVLGVELNAILSPDVRAAIREKQFATAAPSTPEQLPPPVSAPAPSPAPTPENAEGEAERRRKFIALGGKVIGAGSMAAIAIAGTIKGMRSER